LKTGDVTQVVRVSVQQVWGWVQTPVQQQINKQKTEIVQVDWLTLAILATWEKRFARWWFKWSPGKNFARKLCQSVKAESSGKHLLSQLH
jgi:hypothetical protein